MSNVFLNGDHSEIETAILLEQAKQCDLGKLNPDYENAVAFTDGKRVYVNSDDRLAEILPAYDHGMLKWLLWHEKYHMELRHHKRFFDYLKELKETKEMDDFKLTHNEVNIIMDILVHDSLARMFPELVETATNNLAQMRNRNSLGYTFKSHNLEDMLDEYKKHKRGEDDVDHHGPGEPPEDDKDHDGPTMDDPTGTPTGSKPKDTDDKDKTKDEPKKEPDDKKTGGDPGHARGGSGKSSKGRDKEEKEPEVHDTPTEPTPEPPSEPTPAPEHDKTDWSKLKKIDDREFITEDEADEIDHAAEQLRRKKFKLARLTETLNGLATTTKTRTYSVPSYMNVSKGVIMKGKKPGKTPLYLVFDASGSMGEELDLFKDIISKSIPHAMNVPCEWFAGWGEKIPSNPEGRNSDYYKGTFKDIMPVYASSGYDDDGDRTIELCLKAEEKGFSPIGVTDGGGCINRPDLLKKLQRTILVGHRRKWLEKAKEINPRIQILDI